MAADMETPPIQLATAGRNEPLVANHFHLSLKPAPTRSSIVPLKWYLWQVDFPEDLEAGEEWTSRASKGKGKGKGKGKIRKKAFDEDHDPPRNIRDAAMDLALRKLEDAAWIYDGHRQLWVRADEDDQMQEIASAVQSVQPDFCHLRVLVAFVPTKEDGDDSRQRSANLELLFTRNLDDQMLVEKQFLQVALAGIRAKQSLRKHAGPTLELINRGRRSIFPGKNRELFDLQETTLAHGRQLWWGFMSQVNFVTGADGKRSMMTLSLNMVPTVGIPEMKAMDLLAVLLAENYSKSVRDRDSNREYYANQLRKNIFPNELIQSRLRSTLMSEAGLKKIKVSVDYFGHVRRKVIVGISDKGADSLMFPFSQDGDDEKSMISVEEYFKLRYKVTLKYPKLPCLALGTDANWVPIELVTVMGGEHNIMAGKMRPEYQGDVVKASAMAPNSRKTAIERAITMKHYAPSSSLELLGIETELKLAKVEGRVLPPPRLRGKDAEVQIGNFSGRVKATRTPGYEVKWGLWSFARSRDRYFNDIKPDLEDFKEALMQAGWNMGVRFAKPSFCEIPEAAHEAFHSKNIIKWQREVGDALWYRCRSHEIKLLVIVLPEKSDWANTLRCFLKALTETDPEFYRFGVVTQCVAFAGADPGKGGTKGKGRGTGSKAANLMLKILPKLPFSIDGKGCCHSVELSQIHPLLQVPTMVIGADVTHHVGGVSIAGVVATRDRSFVNYFSYILAQTTSDEESQKVRTRQSQEKIVHLDLAIESLLRQWQNVNSNKLPAHIFYYRDGVSDGQFFLVLRHEYNKLLDAFRRVGGPEYKPKVAIIVGQKRHQTRFFKDPKGKPGGPGAGPAVSSKGKGSTAGKGDDKGKGKGKEGFECQPDPGTAVSGGLCDLGHLNFYLVSQDSKLGTAVPCHYHVLHLDDFRLPDKSKAGINDLQRITYDLCHLYSRSDKTVGYAAPAYLADHLAERGKDWLESQYSLAESSNDDPMRVQERVRWLNRAFSEFEKSQLDGRNFFL